MSNFDPDIPPQGGYFHNEAKQAWHPVFADQLTAMLKSSSPPEYRTVLGIIGEVSCDMPTENLKYLGSLYIDIDGNSITEAITADLILLSKLSDMGISLHSIRHFATGGRGFHIEVPMQAFMVEIPTEGVLNLPHIYKAMAEVLYVECLDLRVYSAKKGRMWRTPNRQRSNGMFKVPLTVAEALNMTPESYAELTSSPRAFPPLAPPSFCPELALLYDDALEKVSKDARKRSGRRASSARVNAELVRRFGGELPPTLAALGQGRFPARGGFNLVAMQLAITAHAVGMSEAELITACAGLIESHESDGRYNTPARRRDELCTQYAYVGNSSGYEFSIGGARAILPHGLRSNDFRGM
jgi:hypothetical protein